MNIERYLPSPELQAEFEKFKTLKTKEEKEAFKKEKKERFNSMSSEEKEAYKTASLAGIEETIRQAQDFITRADEVILKDKLGELPEAISFSYIAKKYFGKSRNWLYQRINGYTVNGKSAQFTQSEYDTFLSALEDIGKMIHNTSASLKLN